MDKKRYKYLNTSYLAMLTSQEIEEGWHFCWDWDGLLIHKDDPEAESCTCRKHKETSE